MRMNVTSALPMRGQNGDFRAEELALEVDDEGRYHLHLQLPWETWVLADQAREFHLEPAVRRPVFLGEFPTGTRVHIEAVAAPEVAARLSKWPDPKELVRGFIGASAADLIRRSEGWYALNVKREMSPGFFVGFETTWKPHALPAGGEGTTDERLRAAVVAGEGVREVLAELWDGLDTEAQTALGDALVALLVDAPEASRDDVIACITDQPAGREAITWPLLRSWPGWLGERRRRVAAAACGGAAWLPEQVPVLEDRATRSGAWSEWVTYLVRTQLRDAPGPIAAALKGGGVVELPVYEELALAVTTWSKEALGPICRAIANGSPVEKAKWRLALAKRLKNESPLWSVVGPALEDPLHVDGPDGTRTSDATTDAYRAFLAGLDANPHGSYTFDVAAFRALDGAEATTAAAEILARIAAGEPRALETAGAVGLSQAVEALRGWAGGTNERAHIARRALLRLGASPPDDVAATLVTGSTQARIAAAQALAAGDDCSSQAALLVALDDAEVVVRVHAWNGLLRARDLTRIAAVRWSTLGRLAVALFTDLDSVRRPAAEAARAALRAWDDDIGRAGVRCPPGPVPEVDRFIASLSLETWDVDAVRAMPPPHAAWARQVLIGALPRGDERASDALARLGDATAIGPLTEAGARRPDFAGACKRAIEALAGR